MSPLALSQTEPQRKVGKGSFCLLRKLEATFSMLAVWCCSIPAAALIRSRHALDQCIAPLQPGPLFPAAPHRCWTAVLVCHGCRWRGCCQGESRRRSRLLWLWRQRRWQLRHSCNRSSLGQPCRAWPSASSARWLLVPVAAPTRRYRVAARAGGAADRAAGDPRCRPAAFQPPTSAPWTPRPSAHRPSCPAVRACDFGARLQPSCCLLFSLP